MKKISSERISVTSDIESTRSNISGISPKIMATVENKKVMIKGDATKEAYAEYFAYRLGSFLGLNINKVGLTDEGSLLGLPTNLCSIHWWEENFVEFAQARQKIENINEKFSKELYQMRLFDLIIENEDRHIGNYGIIDNKLFLIDNGLSRPWYNFDGKNHYDITNEIYNSSFSELIKNENCLDIVKQFAALSDYRIKSFVKLPSDIEVNDFRKNYINTLSKEIISRMRNIRKYFRVELKSMGVAYK